MLQSDSLNDDPHDEARFTTEETGGAKVRCTTLLEIMGERRGAFDNAQAISITLLRRFLPKLFKFFF
jgi:hypothetical protein